MDKFPRVIFEQEKTTVGIYRKIRIVYCGTPPTELPQFEVEELGDPDALGNEIWTPVGEGSSKECLEIFVRLLAQELGETILQSEEKE